MLDSQTGLPSSSHLSTQLGFQENSALDALLDSHLLAPIGRFLSRPGKRFRTQLLEFAFRAVNPDCDEQVVRQCCERGAFIVESIHCASMVIDDIEDGSTERRGKPALHQEVGMPVALNAGNWLYFYPLSVLSQWKLPAETEVQLYRLCVDAVMNAHCGQAIDVGVCIDKVEQSAVEATCIASMQLKTGALTGLATALGAVLGGGSPFAVESLKQYGISFGTGLQMFDDIGNLSAERMGPKQFEDLFLRRPTWVWACAAKGAPDQYRRFLEAVESLPSKEPLDRWLKETQLVSAATRGAVEHLEKALHTVQAWLPKKSWDWVCNASERLKEAYV